MKKGTIVQVKSWEEMAGEFGYDYDEGAIPCAGSFVDGMKHLCGKKIKLNKDVEDDSTIGFYKTAEGHDFLAEGGPEREWEITTDMVKPVEPASFRKGDKVKLIETTIIDEVGGFKIGDKGIITNLSGAEIYVKFNNRHGNYLTFDWQLEKIDMTPQDILNNLYAEFGIETPEPDDLLDEEDDELIDELIDENEEFRQMIDTLEGEVGTLETNLLDALEEIKDLTEENEELYTEIDDSRKELICARESNNEMYDVICDLNEEIDFLRNTVEQLKEELENQRYNNAFMQRFISKNMNNN